MSMMITLVVKTFSIVTQNIPQEQSGNWGGILTAKQNVLHAKQNVLHAEHL